VLIKEENDMKKIFAMAVIVMLVAFVAATGALAAAFNVTTESGVRVSEQGTCEQIGSSEMEGGGENVWLAGTIITIELLRGTTICRAIDPEAEGDRGDYVVEAIPGNDFLTITVVTDNFPGPIVYGDEATRICFDLSGTDYNSTTNQLVEVTYRDTSNNTYSGDFVVATVKPAAHSVRTCSKGEREAADLPGDSDIKTGLPIIVVRRAGPISR
jgi:hypothetical protein